METRPTVLERSTRTTQWGQRTVAIDAVASGRFNKVARGVVGVSGVVQEGCRGGRAKVAARDQRGSAWVTGGVAYSPPWAEAGRRAPEW